MKIRDRTIGPGASVYIVAEIGINHNGSLMLAREMVHAAAESGADAVKFQKRKVESVFTRAALARDYADWLGGGGTYGDYKRALELAWTSYEVLVEEAASRGLDLGITFFDEESVREFSDYFSVREFNSGGGGVAFAKIGSPDVTNLPLVHAVARLKMPMVISTGMSSLTEVSEAVAAAASHHRNLLLMHCISAYPPSLEDLNLRVIPRLGSLYDLPVGYSGHEAGNLAVAAAVALGACAVEKHFTLTPRMRGSDQGISLGPEEFQRMVAEVRRLGAALGETREVLAPERPVREKLSKGIVAARRLPTGHVLARDDLAFKSPARGLPPSLAHRLIGRKLVAEVGPDDPILLNHLEEE